MKIEEAKEILNKYNYVEDWSLKVGLDNEVYCIDLTIKDKGWVRIYNKDRCNDNINSNAGISVDKIDAQTIIKILDDYKNIKLKNECIVNNFNNKLTFEQTEQILNKYECVIDWVRGTDEFGFTDFLNIGIGTKNNREANKGWINIYDSNSADPNEYSDKNIEVNGINEKVIDDILRPFEEERKQEIEKEKTKESYCNAMLEMLYLQEVCGDDHKIKESGTENLKTNNFAIELYIDGLPNEELKPNFNFLENKVCLAFHKEQLKGLYKLCVYNFETDIENIKNYIDNKNLKESNDYIPNNHNQRGQVR